MEEFERIYREYFTDVYRYMIRLCGDPSLAEEITAETFFRAIHAMHTFRNESSIKSWLCAIAKNIFLDQTRQSRHRTDLSDTGMMRLPDPSPGPDAQLAQREQVQMILDAAEQLKEPYRTVFRMRYIQEYSFKTIAAKYRRSENWACVTCHRAKEMIRKEIENDE